MPDGQYTQFPIDYENISAAKVPYDNTGSGLIAENVQDAIDEVAQGGGGGGGDVTSVNGMTGAVVLDANDVGALPDDTVVPSTAAEVGALATTGGTMSGAIAMGGFKITGLATGTADTDAANTKQVDDAIANLGEVLDFKGAVQDVTDLPSSGNRGGDVYLVRSLGAMFVWAETGTGGAYEWDEMGEHIDLSGYIQTPSSPTSGQFLSWNGSAWVAADLPVYTGGVL